MGKRNSSERSPKDKKKKKKEKKHHKSKKHAELTLVDAPNFSDSPKVYNIFALCAECNTVRTGLISSEKITPQLNHLLCSIRVESGTFNTPTNCAEVADPLEMASRILFYHLLDSSKKHECLSGIELEKFPDIGWSKDNCRGSLCKLDLFASNSNSATTTQYGGEVLPHLHGITSNRFCYIPKGTIFVQISFAITSDWLLHIGESLKKKRKKSKKESISLD